MTILKSVWYQKKKNLYPILRVSKIEFVWFCGINSKIQKRTSIATN